MVQNNVLAERNNSLRAGIVEKPKWVILVSSALQIWQNMWKECQIKKRLWVKNFLSKLYSTRGKMETQEKLK